MEEKVCIDCGRALTDSQTKFCSVCAPYYATRKSDLSGKNKGFPPKGRDRVSERLRDGFRMIDDDEDPWA